MVPERQPVTSQNYYEALAEQPVSTTAEPEQNPPAKDTALESSPTKSAPRPSRARRKQQEAERQQTRPREEPADPKEKQETALEAQQVYDRPHQASYFIPGRVEGRPVQFLLDTGCTTNLLGKHVFDRLPERIKSQKEEYSRHGLLADGTRLPFYGILKLDIRLRQVKTTGLHSESDK